MNLLSPKIQLRNLIFTTLFLISCGSDDIVYPEGGYPYLKNLSPNDTNFYFLPIRNTIGRRDSIIILLGKEIYASFNEPNLSISPPDEDLFRFNYYGWPGYSAIFTLTKDKIIIKEAIAGSPYKAPEENNLDSTEQLHYNLLYTQYHLSDPKLPTWRKMYIDSLLKVYPYLFDPAYYLKLTNKKFSITQPFEYSKKEIEISTSVSNKIVNIINNSGYWKRPYYNEDCNIMDGSGFFLEAITKQKYKSIYFTLCPDDSSDLRKAYNEVLKYAGIKNGKLGRRDTIPVKSTAQIETREVKMVELKPETKTKKKKVQ